VGSKSWCIPRGTEIPHDQLVLRETTLQIGFKIGKVNHPLAEAISKQDEVLAFFEFDWK
jgi:hypothetical protein